MAASSETPVSPALLAAVASSLQLAPSAVAAVLRLAAEGATVPFMARYRKEATQGLDEVQLRAVLERHGTLSELEARREVVRRELEGQGVLHGELAARLAAASTKAELEDLYLPFKPKRRTRASMARERGLAPLAERVWAQPPSGDPEHEARAFLNADVPDVDAALAGARDLCAERIAELPEVRATVRSLYFRTARFRVEKTKDHKDKPTKFDSYAAFEELAERLAPHRALAIRRGEAEKVLRVSVCIDVDRALDQLVPLLPLGRRSPWRKQLGLALEDSLARLLGPSVENELRAELWERADRAAADVFAQNVRELLLAAPFGERPVLAIDPGQRTGCKCAVLDGTGRYVEHTVLQLTHGDAALERAAATLLRLCRAHQPAAIAVGNGTHGRETESFVRDTLRAAGLGALPCVAVSESGASVYSASELAREEHPELDVTIRGALSIGRRLQDPLAELVKIDPKSIGVGQYQHDVPEPLLAARLDAVVESAVNAVGVELNTASAPLLERVSGIGKTLAKKLVAHRVKAGPFRSRRALLQVSGLGPRTFEQAAGFLRVRDGEHPLDSSAVHPERYALVERIARDLGVAVEALIGNRALLARVDRSRYEDAANGVGRFTLDDIFAELEKPGRDPRAEFEAPAFRDDVRTITDLRPGMVLDAVVTNVTAFGAFVDLGVHQDGLIHVSQLADRFVADPSAVTRVGARLKVRVLSVDVERRRIACSAKSD